MSLPVRPHGRAGAGPREVAMASLWLGARGREVSRLQARLKKVGFSPGKVDGDFGLATEAAVLAFQRSAGLLPDGIAGPRTLAALALPVPRRRGGLGSVTVDKVARMFPHTPLRNIDANLPFVVGALKDAGLTDKPMVLMALATIRAETEGFQPVSEAESRYNTSPDAVPFDLYDHRRDLGNQGPPDGKRFRGRGFVQLTGRDNYRRHGAAIGLGDLLLRRPEKANDPEIAAKLLASFLASKERPIKEALLDGDMLAARRLVNGGSHGLDRFSEAYAAGQRLLA